MREKLLLVTVLLTSAGYIWLLTGIPDRLRAGLGLMTVTFVAAGAIALLRARARLTPNLLKANLALGAILHLVAACLIVVGDRLVARGLLPTLTESWIYFLVAVLGIAAALFSWSWARGKPEEAADAEPPAARTEAALEPAPSSFEDTDWEAAERALDGPQALSQLRALQRISRVLDEEGAEAARRTVDQEVFRLTSSARAASAQESDDDVLSKVAEFVEWGVQKIPELAKMDVPDLLLARCVAEIRARHTSVEKIFVDHRRLIPIHPIDRPTAEAKADERAVALRAAMPLVDKNGRKLSEALIAAHDELKAFQSVTGFQVVELAPADDGPRYVTFEGNGRAGAIARALKDEPLEVEVRLFKFDNARALEKIRGRVREVQKSNGVLKS